MLCGEARSFGRNRKAATYLIWQRRICRLVSSCPCESCPCPVGGSVVAAVASLQAETFSASTAEDPGGFPTD